MPKFVGYEVMTPDWGGQESDQCPDKPKSNVRCTFFCSLFLFPSFFGLNTE